MEDLWFSEAILISGPLSSVYGSALSQLVQWGKRPVMIPKSVT